MAFKQQTFQDVTIAGLNTQRSHAAAHGLVRIYFQLAVSPPLGWAYIFTSVWQTVQYPFKRQAGMEGGEIWIECLPEELAPYHIDQLKQTVEVVNQRYRDKAIQTGLEARREAGLNDEIRIKLQDLNRNLYPEMAAAEKNIPMPGFWSRNPFKLLKRLFA